MTDSGRIRLVKGSNDVLREEQVRASIDEFVADGDRSLLLDEFTGADYELGALVDAAQTLPFLTERRVVVGRHLGRFATKDALGPLLHYLDEPSTTTDLVLVWERSPEPGAKFGGTPPTLSKAVQAAGGEVVSADAPGGKDLGRWVAEQLGAHGVRLDAAATRLVVERLGDDPGALVELAERLRGLFGEEKLGADDVEPFLGTGGGVPPWEITDAIEKGDAAVALDKLQRSLQGGGRHPLQVFAPLQSWVERLTRLSGARVGSDREAADVLGMKGSTFPAKKALAHSRRLGPAGVRRSLELVARADLDLRGAQAWPPDLVLEVLVARLAAVSRAASRSGARG